MKKLFIFSMLLSLHDANALKINRVILAVDTNPMYIQFWPVTARAWHKILGVRPTLALIADSSVHVDESVGDVIRFDPIPGIPTSLQAQTIRLLLPVLFENDVCILSDIEMMPLSRKYFENSVKSASENSFVVFRDRAYYGSKTRFPMCYNVAKGRVFKEIFKINSKEEISIKIKEWANLGFGWNTDELVLTKMVKDWSLNSSRLVLLGHKVTKRINRNLKYNRKLLSRGHYIDLHSARPYDVFKEKINTILRMSVKKNLKEHGKKHGKKCVINADIDLSDALDNDFIEEVDEKLPVSFKERVMRYPQEIKDTLELVILGLLGKLE